MPFVLAKLLRRVLATRTGVPAAAVIMVVFATSWPLMALAEPASNSIAAPERYWWWFLVTTSTVGYGDYYPETTAGQLVAGYVIVGGIATLTTLFAQLSGVIERARGRRMHGAVTLDTSGHVVLLGYTPGRTERIVTELLAEDTREVVLCAFEGTTDHPMPDTAVAFVRGDLASEDALRRACVPRASSVLVDARDDNEALAMTVAVDHLRGAGHVVVALRDMGRAQQLRYVDPRVRCVQWHTPRMVAEELQDPGISEVYAELMTHGGSSTYTVRLPRSLGEVNVGRCQTALGQHHSAILLAIRSNEDVLVSPGWQEMVPAGALLYYVCRQRLTGEQLADALRPPGTA